MLIKSMLLVSDDVKKWWIWGYWISPMMYAQNAISVNEFLGNSWRHVSILYVRKENAKSRLSNGINI